MSAQTKLGAAAVAERVAGARDVARHQLDAGVARTSAGVGGPAARASGRSPAPALVRREQAGEQALAAADVEHARAAARSGRARADGGRPDRSPACRARSARRSGRRCRYGALAASTSAGQPAAAACSWRRRGVARPRRRGAGSASRQGHARRPAARDALEQRRQHVEHHRPAGAVRAAWPSCSSRMSPAARPRVRRASTVGRRRARTVSKPRRVQLTSCRPRRCSTGARKGLRKPGRRAKEARRARR